VLEKKQLVHDAHRRRFSLRGLKQVAGEWTLVCLAWNLKRMAVLRLQ
jgi:hypothetical protein